MFYVNDYKYYMDHLEYRWVKWNVYKQNEMGKNI